MSLYDFVKFLHVSSAIAWIGGGLSLVILGTVADMRKDNDSLVRIVRNVAFLATRMFLPASVATLVFGLVVAWLQWSFANLWIDIGILGWIATALTGNFVLGPRAQRIQALVAKSGATGEVVAAARELLQLAKFDYVVLYVIVADMVIKPTIDNWIVLLVMVLAIVAGAIRFLGPAMRPSQPAAA